MTTAAPPETLSAALEHARRVKRRTAIGSWVLVALAAVLFALSFVPALGWCALLAGSICVIKLAWTTIAKGRALDRLIKGAADEVD